MVPSGAGGSSTPFLMPLSGRGAAGEGLFLVLFSVRCAAVHLDRRTGGAPLHVRPNRTTHPVSAPLTWARKVPMELGAGRVGGRTRSEPVFTTRTRGAGKKIRRKS